MSGAFFDSPFEIKFYNTSGRFEGYASVFEVTDSASDRVLPGAFAKSLANWQTQGRQPPLLWQHDQSQPIGAWRELREDRYGLYAQGELFVNDIARAKEAYCLLREKVVNGLSIGYRVKQSTRDSKTGIRLLSEVELLEISMVTFPANESARVLRVKKQDDEIAVAIGRLTKKIYDLT